MEMAPVRCERVHSRVQKAGWENPALQLRPFQVLAWSIRGHQRVPCEMEPADNRAQAGSVFRAHLSNCFYMLDLFLVPCSKGATMSDVIVEGTSFPKQTEKFHVLFFFKKIFLWLSVCSKTLLSIIMLPEYACSCTVIGVFFANEKWANEESDEKRGAMDEEVQAPLSLFACVYHSLISHQPDMNTFSRTLECTGNPIHPDFFFLPGK